MMAGRWWKVSVLWILALAIAYAIIGPSEAFDQCIRDRESHAPYQAAQKEISVFVKVIPLVRLNAACAFVAANENTGAITGVAGIVVAIFAITLWGATRRLWRSAESQLIELRRSLDESRSFATRQAAQMHASIVQATRAADAMENVSSSTERSARAAAVSARAAEQALIDLERPWLFVELDLEIVDQGYDTSGGRIGSALFAIANYGRFPATIIECHSGIAMHPMRPYPTIRRDEWHRVVGPGQAIENCMEYLPVRDEIFEIESSGSDHIPRRRQVPATTGDEEAFFYITIEYRGAGANAYKSAFCWRWDDGVHYWVRFDDEEYNYQN
jgi:hypothetical protein